MNKPINIKIEDYDIFEEVARTIFKEQKPTDDEIEKWIKENYDKLKEKIEDQINLRYILQNFNKSFEDREVKKPVLSFNGGKLQLWVYDAGQHIQTRSMGIIGNEETGGLLYVEKNIGYYEREENIWNESTWQWIQEWMEKGMKAEGVINSEGKEVKAQQV